MAPCAGEMGAARWTPGPPPDELRLASEPPPLDLASILLCTLPALAAAAYAVVTAALGQLSPARRVALRDTLTGSNRAALDRYLSAPSRLEARWLMLRVAGIAATAGLLSTAVP